MTGNLRLRMSKEEIYKHARFRLSLLYQGEKEKEYFTFRYTNQQNLTKLKSVIEIVNWAKLQAHNNPSQACRKFLQKHTATIYNRSFLLQKKLLRLKRLYTV